MSAEISEQLAQIPLIRAGSERLLDALARDARAMKFTKRGQIASVGDEASRFYLITSGWVKLYRETYDGAEAIVDILTAGHLFGETALFENETYPFSAEATEAVSVISLPIRELKTEIETSPSFAMAMMASMAHYRRHQDMELEHRTLQSAPQRIGCFLLRLADQEETGPVELHLPYDKSLMASRLGMKPETFSRALGKLRSDTKIAVKGALIMIEDVQELADYACTACSSEFPCKDKIHSASI